jgi:hypothetical protein
MAMSHGKRGRSGSNRSKWTNARMNVSWARSAAPAVRSIRQQKRKIELRSGLSASEPEVA